MLNLKVLIVDQESVKAELRKGDNRGLGKSVKAKLRKVFVD
jgi:hypothetical protein